MKLRVARPTNSLANILKFYRDGLGLDVVGRFTDHDGFSGVMLGQASLPYHFEFTSEEGKPVPKAPTKENLFAFYFPDESKWNSACARMQKNGFAPVKSHNPYWDEHGKTFEDFEGYRVVLVNGDWPAEPSA